MTSPVKSLKRKLSNLDDNFRSSFDPQADEEFLKAEEELKNDHTAFYQLFLDIPEVHPDYSLHYVQFKTEYNKRFGNEPENFKKLWDVYWYEVIQQKQEEDWDLKIRVLIRQYQVKSSYEEKAQEKRQSGLKMQYNSISSDEESSGSNKESKWKNIVVDGSSPNNIPLSHSLELLENVCDSLGDIFGSVLKRVIKKINESTNTEDIISFLSNKDTVKLLKWAAGKLKVLGVDAEGAQKNKLLSCSNIALKLIIYGIEGTWNANHNRLDIEKIAISTFNKDIPTTLSIIEESLKLCGIESPTRRIVNSVFSQVSSHHVKMALSK
ncbi:hypothetical protein SK128_028175 [Halocaridina rubra]|uniref:Uncharacterized protein n=1 Tax=Halocaridina rubra TaxID=373956 RepID=A0AAN8ZNT1_HALRR